MVSLVDQREKKKEQDLFTASVPFCLFHYIYIYISIVLGRLIFFLVSA